jgi:hypothetical protein
VEAALTVIRSALANGVSWPALEELVSIEKKAGNPIASLILKLKVTNYYCILHILLHIQVPS